MSRRAVLFGVLAALLIAEGVGAQGRILDMVANKVIGKYEGSTCEQLRQKREEPKSEEEQRAVEFLRNDQQARVEFLNKVAGPIANKLFDCGMIP